MWLTTLTTLLTANSLIVIGQVPPRQQTTVNFAVILDGDETVKDAVEAAISQLSEKINVKHETVTLSANPNREQLEQLLRKMMEKDGGLNAVLDTTRKGVPSDTIKTVTKALKLVTVSTSYGYSEDLAPWNNLTDEERGYLVQVRPPGDTMAECVRDLVSRFSFSNAAIIFDHTFVMDHQYKHLLLNLPTRHIIQTVASNDTGLRHQLLRFREADIANYFLFTSAENTNRIFKMAGNNAMFGRNYAWYVVSKNISYVKNVCHECKLLMIVPEPVNRTLFERFLERFPISSERTVDWSFHFDVTVATVEAVANHLESNASQNGRDPFNLNLKHKGMFGEFLLASNGLSKQQMTLNLTKLMFKNGGLAQILHEGTWTSGLLNNSLNLIRELKNFLPILLYSVTTIEAPPFVYKVQHPDGRVQFQGLCIDMLDSLKSIIEFEYEIYEVPDRRYGKPNDKGVWNGVFGELANKRAHMALGPIFVTSERETVVDFTIPFYDLVGIRILMARSAQETSLFRFLSVMEASVWGCILAAYFCTSVLLWLVDRFSPFSYQNNREKYKDDPERREFTLKESLWFCVTSLTPQGGGDAPRNASGRMVAATWWLFSFIVIASYTANLAAFLTVTRLESTVDSLEALANQYRIQYAPINGTTVMQYFERMANIETRFYEIWKDMSLNASISDKERAELSVWDYPVSERYTKMWQAMKETGMPQTFAEGLQRIRNESGHFALLADSTDARYAVLVTCDTMIVGDEFSRRPYGIAVQKGSPLKEQLSLGILKLQNRRDLERFKEKWWQQNPHRILCDDSDEQADGIGMSNIGGVFIVVCLGIAVAAVTLIFEYWWYKVRGRKIASTPVQVLTAEGATQLKAKQALGSQAEKPLTNRRYYFAS